MLKRDKLINEGHRFGGDNSRPLIMPDVCGINIDNKLDLDMARLLLEKSQ